MFIHNFTKVTQLLTQLTRKGIPFQWDQEQQEAFNTLKAAFMKKLMLHQWDPKQPTWVEMDYSRSTLGSILSQEDGSRQRYVVAYYSQWLSPTKYNYPIHDKEMLAIVRCLSE